MSPRPKEDRIRAVGVVIPVNNEEHLLGKALNAVERSLLEVAERGLHAHVVVVLDSCGDDSGSIARAWEEDVRATAAFNVTIVEFEGESVGRARALGCDVLLALFAAIDPAEVWIATTDADSRVPSHWLCTQLAAHERGADAWAGRVSVTEWPHHRRASAAAWQRAYDAEVGPIHGASLGVVAEKYVDVGGFQSVRTGEDRALCASLLSHGAHIHYDASALVVTSARRHARAPDGFASALTRYDVREYTASHDEVYSRHA
jgi:hypothetical protein